MAYETKKIKEGITIHTIETEKFKTNLIAVFLTVPLKRETVTNYALIPAVLKRGTNFLKTQEEINIKLEEMYDASFDCGIDKVGDNQVIKCYLEALNDEFTLNNEQILKQSLDLIFEIIFNPLIENSSFKEEYVKTEKENMKKLILSKIDNKDKYALESCIEEMYKGKDYGIYKFGYIEDLEHITAKNLYDAYLELINKAKIDIFVSGKIDKQEILKEIEENQNLNKLNPRIPNIVKNTEETEIKEAVEPKEIKDIKEVSQGKVVIGLDIAYNKKDSRYQMALYNVILGESATSKLFQNVREKASLAYSARSNYIRQKNNIYIRCGIEIEKYEEALKIIKEQLEDMKNGNFSEEDLNNAKKYMLAGIRTVQDEQDSEVTYYFGQEISGTFTTFDEYMNKINGVSRDEIIEVANSIKINTIYFLRN